MNLTADIPLILTLLALFLGAVVLAAAEASLLRVRRVRIEVLAEQGRRSAKRLLRLLDDLARVMNAVLLTVLLLQIGAATVTGLLAERHFGSLGITIASIVLTLVLFVYAEAIPKTFAVRQPTVVALRLSGPIAALARLLQPVVTVLVAFADLQAPGKGVAAPIGVSETELRRLAAQAASAGEIADSDLELIERAFHLGDQRVDEILVPRIEVVAVPGDATAAEALETAIGAGHRRLPVYDGDLDHITGVVRLRDLVRASIEDDGVSVAAIAAPVLVVPESKRVIELLREMQAAGLHVAVAVDEHGGTAGIVTIEDVVEELVGQVADEGEARVSVIQRLAEGQWTVNASADVADLERALGVSLPEGEWHTVAGLVMELAGHIPSVNETFEASGHRFRVVAASRRRVTQIEVERIAAP